MALVKPPLHTEEEMQALKKSYRGGVGQVWECWTDNYDRWYQLPKFYQPGWFTDTLYRRVR